MTPEEAIKPLYWWSNLNGETWYAENSTNFHKVTVFVPGCFVATRGPHRDLIGKFTDFDEAKAACDAEHRKDVLALLTKRGRAAIDTAPPITETPRRWWQFKKKGKE